MSVTVETKSVSSQSLKRKAIHGAMWYGSSRVVTQAISWVATIFVLRLVSPADYGLLGMALMYVGVVDFLNDLGFGAVIVQKKELAAEDLDTLFWFSNAVGVLCAVVTFFGAPLVASFFKQPALVPLLRFMGVY